MHKFRTLPQPLLGFYVWREFRRLCEEVQEAMRTVRKNNTKFPLAPMGALALIFIFFN